MREIRSLGVQGDCEYGIDRKGRLWYRILGRTPWPGEAPAGEWLPVAD